MKNWPKISEKIVYKGYREVLRRTFILPNNQRADYDVIHSQGGVGILAVTPDYEIVCFTQFRPGPEKILFELPGGGIDTGEDIHTAIKRELSEETGYGAEIHYIGSYYKDAYISGRWHMFVGKDAQPLYEQRRDLLEFGEVSLLSIDKFKDVLFNGQLTDTTLGYAGLRYLGLL